MLTSPTSPCVLTSAVLCLGKPLHIALLHCKSERCYIARVRNAQLHSLADFPLQTANLTLCTVAAYKRGSLGLPSTADSAS